MDSLFQGVARQQCKDHLESDPEMSQIKAVLNELIAEGENYNFDDNVSKGIIVNLKDQIT